MATMTRRSAAPATARTPVARAVSGFRGEEGRRRMLEEERRAAARKEAAQSKALMPFRFFCMPGESREIVVVDDEPDFFRFEHALQDSRTKRWDVFCACLDQNANCPVCKVAERPSYYALYLTIIDLTPYEDKHGVEVPWSKKLLVVKTAQQKKIMKYWERHGTLRGMILTMTRDGARDAQIGNDIEFVEMMPEEELLTYETQYEYEKDGKTVVKDIIGHEVFNYEELFPPATEQHLRALVGGRPEPGSREESEHVRSSRGRSAPADEFPDDPPPRSSRTPVRTARAASRAIPPEDDPSVGADPEEGEVQGDPPPSRRAPVTASRVARAPSRQEYADDPPQRQTRAAPATRSVSRAARPDPEPAEEEGQDDGGSTRSLAERRRALRR